LSKGKRKKEKKRGYVKWIILLSVLFVFGGVLVYVDKTYTITTVYVDGNVHYTADEIKEMVLGDRLSGNSLYLSMKYRMKGMDNIPFVSAMDVQVLAPDTIRITVYEKSLAGYVEYLGRYMYFDKDGTVVEASTEQTAGIPLVTGLDFDHVVLYEPLPVENTDVFAQILDTTQMLKKYNLSADRIYFNINSAMTIYFGEVRVDIGNRENMDDKFMFLTQNLDKLNGESGVLRLENYDESTRSVTFEPDKQRDTPAEQETEAETEETDHENAENQQ